MMRPIHTEQKQPYVDDACKLLLHFNGASGSQQFIDSSNNPKVVTAYGNACLSNSHYRFGGTSGYLATKSTDYIASPLNANLDSTITAISCWINTAITGWGVLFDMFNSSGSERFVAQIYDNSYVYLRDVGVGTTWYKFNGVTGLNDSKWHHLYITYDGSNYALYIDGVQKTLVTEGGAAGTTGSTNGIYIGKRLDAGLDGYVGYIDEFIIWKDYIPPIGMVYPQLRPYGYPIGGT